MEGRSPTGAVKVWTFLIRGGEPFRLGLSTRLGPLLDHKGGAGSLTVWKMTGTAEEAVQVENMITGSLIGARVQRHTEEEDAEMVKARFQGEGEF